MPDNPNDTTDKVVQPKDQVAEASVKNAFSQTTDTKDNKEVSQKESDRVKQTTEVHGMDLHKEDGSVVTYDKGRVTKVVDANHQTHVFDYNADGKLVGGTDAKGNHWSTKDGKHWEDDKGRKWEGTVSVDKEGNITRVGLHATERLGTDGSIKITPNKTEHGDNTKPHAPDAAPPKDGDLHKQDGSVVTYEHGRVTKIVDANNHTRSYEYGADGKLSGGTDDRGHHWKTADGKHWENEKGQKWEGTVKVDQDGSVTITGERGSLTRGTDGSYKFTRAHHEQTADTTGQKPGDNTQKPADNTQKPGDTTHQPGDTTQKPGDTSHLKTSDTAQHKPGDGATPKDGVVTNKDGSVVTYENGHVTKVVDANHQTRSYEYNKDGQVVAGTDPFGHHWTTKDGKHWENENGQKAQFTVKVDDHGNSTITGERYSVTRGTDGSVKIGRADHVTDSTHQKPDTPHPRDGEVHNKDGSEVTYEHGHVSKVVDANHQTRTFEYGADGKLVGGTDSSGHHWKTSDGKHWENEKGQKWEGTAKVDDDGNVTITGKRGSVTRGTDGSVTITPAHKQDTAENTQQKTGDTTHHKPAGTTHHKPADTTQKPADTTQKPADTTQKPADTTQKPADTTQKPADTTQKPADTTQKPADTTQHKPGDTTQKPADTTQHKPTDTTDHTTHHKTADTTHKPADTTQQKPADTTQKPDDKPADKPVEKPVDHQAMEASAEAIRKATGNDNWVARWADKDAINKQLEGKSEAERKVLNDIYKEKYGKSLEDEMSFLSGSDKDKFLSLLHKKDNDKASLEADRIHQKLTENSEYHTPATHKEIQADIVRTLGQCNSKDIAQMDKYYQERYGVTLKGALVQDSNLSDSTKEKAAILCKGADNINDNDRLKLADIALKDKDINSFKDAMQNASPEARKQFIDNGGEQKMKDAFEGHWYNVSKYFDLGVGSYITGEKSNITDQDLHHAEDYAKHGKEQLATTINDANGVVHTDRDTINHAIDRMTDEERRNYTIGKSMAEGKPVDSKLTEDQKKTAQDYYKETHDAMVKAGNSSDVSKWENEIATKDGLVAKVASHRGHIWNDSSNDMLKDIEGMSKEQWKYCQEHPEQRQELQKALETLKGTRIEQSDIDKAMKMYDEKMAAKTYEEAKGVGGRSVLDTVDADTHFYGNDRRAIIDDISHMTKEQQEAYRNNTDGFRDKLDQKLKDNVKDGPALDAAMHLLDKVKQGQPPEADLISKLGVLAQERDERTTKERIADGVLTAPAGGIGGLAETDKMTQAKYEAAFGSHANDVVKAMQEEFQKDPTLRDRINHPKTPEDQKLADQFNKAIHGAMSDADYEKYAKPLLETGHLDVATQMDASTSFFSDDKHQMLQDLANASPEEKQRILADKDAQDKMLGHFSDADKQVALQILNQKDGMHPADDLRYRLNHWGGSSDIMSTLDQFKGHPEAWEQAKNEYAHKYGSDLENDLLDKLGGDDKKHFLETVHSFGTATEQFNYAQDSYNSTSSGYGNVFAREIMGSGTGNAADDALLNYQKAGTAASAQFKDLTPEQTKQLNDKFNTTLQDLRDTKAAAADAVVNGTVATLAIASVIATGGADTPLILGMAAAGGLIKVGAKAALEGDDYDISLGQVSKDLATGAIDGATSVIGPGEVAAIFKVGEAAGVEAAEVTLKQLGEQGVKSMLKEGGQEVIENGTKEVMRESLASGAKKIDEKAIQELAEKAVKPVGDGFTQEMRDKAVKELSENLQKNLTESFKKETASWLHNMGREGMLNAGGGALGGGTAGFSDGVMNWDGSKSFGENMARIGQSTFDSAASGAVMAGMMTAAMKTVHVGYEGLKGLKGEGGEAPRLGDERMSRVSKETPASQESPKWVTTGDGPSVKPGNDAVINGQPLKQGEVLTLGRENFTGDHLDQVSRKQVSLSRDGDGNVILMDHSQNGTYIKPAGGKEFIRVQEGQPVVIHPGDEIRVGSKDGPELKFNEKAHSDTPEVRKLDQPKVPPEGQITSLDKPVSVREGEGPWQRIYQVGDKNYELAKLGDQMWFYGKYPSGETSPVKVHITTDSPADLKKLQEVLIPALNDDPELARLAKGWKTFDPQNGFEIGNPDRFPNGKGNYAKAFTLYTENPEDAVKLQQKIDELLNKKGLSLDRPIDTGNVDEIRGKSNRVGIVRDFFPAGKDPMGGYGALLDSGLSQKIESQFNVKPGERLSDAQLRQVEQQAGIKPNTLRYSEDGKLMLSRYSDMSKPRNGAVYLDESHAIKTPGERTDRQAMYALAERFEAPVVPKPEPQFEMPPVKVDKQVAERPPLYEGFPNREVQIRDYQVGDKTYQLEREGDKGWFYSKDPQTDKSPIGPVKVHVDTNSPEDLKKLQAVLIPALKDDPELQKLVSNWKTFDPDMGVNPGDYNPSRLPNGQGNNGKAFTIYTEDVQKARQIQEKIDQLLKDKGLGLNERIETGNVDKISGESNRVGITRDTFDLSTDSRGKPAALIDAALVDKINQDYHVKPGERLSDTQLRDLESKTGISQGTLEYDRNNQLILRKASYHSDPYHGGIYLDESAAGKQFGEKTDRQAMYALADRYDVDLAEASRPREVPPEARADKVAVAPKVVDAPATPDAHVKFGNQDLNLKVGDQVQLGRSSQAVADGSVSRNHAWIGRDGQGMYVEDYLSTNGTWVKHPGSNQFEQVKGRVYLKPGDEVRLGNIKTTGGVPIEGLDKLPPSAFEPVPGYVPENQNVAVGNMDPAQAQLREGQLNFDPAQDDTPPANDNAWEYRGQVVNGDNRTPVVFRPNRN